MTQSQTKYDSDAESEPSNDLETSIHMSKISIPSLFINPIFNEQLDGSYDSQISINITSCESNGESIYYMPEEEDCDETLPFNLNAHYLSVFDQSDVTNDLELFIFIMLLFVFYYMNIYLEIAIFLVILLYYLST